MTILVKTKYGYIDNALIRAAEDIAPRCRGCGYLLGKYGLHEAGRNWCIMFGTCDCCKKTEMVKMEMPNNWQESISGWDLLDKLARSHAWLAPSPDKAQ